MARKFGYLCVGIILLNILRIVRLTSGEVDESNLQQRFTSKCDDLCVPKADQPTEVNAYCVCRHNERRKKQQQSVKSIIQNAYATHIPCSAIDSTYHCLHRFDFVCAFFHCFNLGTDQKTRVLTRMPIL